MNYFIERVAPFKDRIAVRDATGVFNYQDLLDASANVSISLLRSSLHLEEARVAFFISPSFEYVAAQWGIWRAGGIAIPLCVDHPLPALEYVLKDSQVSRVIIADEHFEFLNEMCRQLNIPILKYSEISPAVFDELPIVKESQGAMILYTSGTTSQPKGVLTTHANIRAQINTLVSAWGWQENDHVLNVLPLHHVHGIINILGCALWSGACCEFLRKFTSEAVWRIFQTGFVNVFMAVPTIYFKLIAYWDDCTQLEQDRMSNSFLHFRLMVSGSAALPVSVLEKWKLISGHTLLERYGMTEIGMGLSNAYTGARIPGHVGLPLPSVQVRLRDDKNKIVAEGEQGEIQIKGPSVFKEYWNRPEATQEAFTDDGWFKTGDIAKKNDGYYQILGRESVDIIKSGGYKISALVIEEVIRKYPKIMDCAVVGIPDEEWGEVVSSVLVVEKGGINLEELKGWLKKQLPPYQVPRKYLLREKLPRNTIGKVTKQAVKELFS